MTTGQPATTPRTACLDVPALPLQLLLRRHPGWTGHAVAVVAEDRPQGLVTWINEPARRSGVRTGMRYAAALSLAPALRADTVSDEDTARGVADVVERLHRFTPGVEPSVREPGIFLLDASGLVRLHGSLAAWAAAVRRDLAAAGLRSRIAVGFTRFGVFAAARTIRDVVIFATEEDENRAARDVPLERLGIDPALRDTLAKLGVLTVGDFLHLPEEQILRRFGRQAQRLRRFAAGGPGAPLVRAVPAEPLEEHAAFEHPETDAQRIVFVAKRLVDRLVARAAARGEAVVEVALTFDLDRHPPIDERLRTATPTLESAQILDLVHLRLASLRLASGVAGVTLTAAAVPATKAQQELFAERPRRDLAAADRAFARLAAEFGEGAVVVAHLADGHLPETQFVWVPLARAVPPRPSAAIDPPLVRRILARPLALSQPLLSESGGFLVSTRWWTGDEIRREYRFATAPGGEVLWVFRDAAASAWSAQGFGR